jgi:hypothetical protein
MQKWDELINNSFLSDENKKALKELIENSELVYIPLVFIYF